MARPRAPTIKRQRRPWTTARTTTMLGSGDLASAKQLVYSANCCFNCCAEQSHKDNVRSTVVEEQLKQRVIHLSEPSSTSLLLISPGFS